MAFFWIAPAARRRFLDRLVIAFDPAHIGRMARYEKALRQRAYLLSEQRGDDGWLARSKRVLAETAVGGYRGAADADQGVERRGGDMAGLAFPGLSCCLGGDTENGLIGYAGTCRLKIQLMAGRQLARLDGDLAMPGPHASDLQALHLASNTPAYLASTGQQKALLIAVVLAHAQVAGTAPWAGRLLCFLTMWRRILTPSAGPHLFEAVQSLGGQCWYSGSDQQQFNELRGKAQFIEDATSRIVGLTRRQSLRYSDE